MPDISKITESVHRLHQYIVKYHFTEGALTGPDPGLRYNFRIWRFAKSYLRFISWNDTTYFLQCQGYWIWNNWKMYEIFQKDVYKNFAISCMERIMNEQTADGFWEYPLKEWKDRIATVDGNYAARGLLLGYKNTQDERYLNAAVRWYDFLTEKGGFQAYRDSLVIRYFAGKDGHLVPNNVTLTLTMNAELKDAVNDDRFLTYNSQMITFLQYAIRESGEFPYAYTTDTIPGREHFLCYQYNCFQFLDLVRYWELTGDTNIYDILKKQIGFIKTGQAPDGHSYYKCGKVYPDVTYYTAVMGAAFLKASEIGLGDYLEEADNAYSYLLRKQHPEGGFPYSCRNYRILSDQRSYPRYLAMILKHLLLYIEHKNNRE